MSNFTKAFKLLMSLEGGGKLHKVKGDRGGWTKYGITELSYPNLNIAELTEQQAEEIYYKDYYCSENADKMSDLIGGAYFISNANMGAKASSRCLQLAINKTIGSNAIAVDGVVGATTLSTLANLDEMTVYNNYKDELVERYKHIAKIGENSKFLKGWINRVNRLDELLA